MLEWQGTAFIQQARPNAVDVSLLSRLESHGSPSRHPTLSEVSELPAGSIARANINVSQQEITAAHAIEKASLLCTTTMWWSIVDRQ